jgi:hypothetical protein
MKRTSIYKYYAFGYNYRLLRQNGLSGKDGNDAKETVDTFLEDLCELELVVAKQIATDLVVLKDSFGNKITAEISEKVKSIVEKIDPALDAELKLRNAYLLTKKRYSIEKLLDSPGELLGEGVYENMDDTAKRDFDLACIQIALSQPTAASFHLMRCLEQQVKTIYFAFKKTKRLQKPMWGPMINELRTKRAPKPSEKLLNHLDGMRIHFRNPTQHPETFYTLDEAQDLLNQTIVAINMVHLELPG